MNRAGQYIENLKGEAAYKSFRPAPLPPELNLNDDVMQLLIDANRHISGLNEIAEMLPNADLFISMYVRKEALISSQIEGTQCTLDDIFNPNIDENVNLDVTDVVNYVKAVNYAVARLDKLPICNRLFCETHEILMEGVRGEDKYPGEFRRSQNWIGPANCSIKEARYIPPNVSDMNSAMTDLEKYINEAEKYDTLVRTALIHYQFETIHPFLDGNGRIGRLLILLYLIEQGLLNKPVIYISYFMKRNQIEYYDRIGEVRRSGNYEQWIKFFLEAVNEAAIDSLNTIKKLSSLHNSNVDNLPQNNKRRDNLQSLFTYIELHPIIDIKSTASKLDISYNTAASAINRLIELNILKETTNRSRNRIFVYEDYLNLLRKGTEI